MNKKGFTLIEMLVVVLIIGILAAVALPQYFKAVEKSRSTEALSVMGSIAAAMERARLVSSNNTYPTTLENLDIEIAGENGSTVTGSSWSSRNFDFVVTGGAYDAGQIQASRKSGTSTYTLTKHFYTGKIDCSEGTTAGTSMKGMCASLGIATFAS